MIFLSMFVVGKSINRKREVIAFFFEKVMKSLK